MSARAIAWAKRQQTGSATAKAVLVMIAEHYSEQWDRSWPKREVLASETELSAKSISRAVQLLEEIGVLRVERWIRLDGTKLSNRYYLPRYKPSAPRADALHPGMPVVVTDGFDSAGKYFVERVEDYVMLQEAA